MRSAKKAVAVVLAAVMAVSMLTACGGGGGGGSGSGGDTPSGGNTGTVTPGGGSGDSGNTPGGGSTDKPGTDTPGGSDDGEDSETVSYQKSRTGAFYKRLAPGKYTIGSIANAIGSNLPEITLVSTDGNRTYVEIFDEEDQNNYQTSVIGLEDKKQKKRYTLIPGSRDDGKKGIYIEEDAEFDDSKNDEISETKPTENGEFTVEKKNTYYIENQIGGKYKKSYWYDGNSSTPKYVIFSEVKSNGQEKEYYRVEFFRVEYKADSGLMDFESILKDYDNVTDDPNYNPGSVKTFQTKFSFKRPIM